MYRNDWYTPNRSRRIPVRRVLHNNRPINEQETNVDNHDQFEWAAQGVWPAQREEHPSATSQPAQGTAADLNEAANGRSTVAQPDNGATGRDDVDWQKLAMQLKADMENYRQRQVRRADDAIAQERDRLIKQFLPIADNLQRALQHDTQSDLTMREGVELVLRQMMQILQNEGVSSIETTDVAFDPTLHEAVATTPTAGQPGIIIDEVETGYTINDKLLRPAKVVVAT